MNSGLGLSALGLPASVIIKFNYRANQVQTKTCFQYANVLPIIKRSIKFKVQCSKFNVQSSMY